MNTIKKQIVSIFLAVVFIGLNPYVLNATSINTGSQETIQFYNDFVQDGDTAVVIGANFEEQGITAKDTEFKLNGKSIKPTKVNNESISFVVPKNTPDNSTFSISCSKQSTPIELKFRQIGISVLNMANLTSELLRDVNNKKGYPQPLVKNQKYLRLDADLPIWEWKSFFWDQFNLTDASVIANPEDYYLQFEISTNPQKPLTSGIIIIGGSKQEYRYPVESNGGIDTEGYWKTISLNLQDLFAAPEGKTYLVDGLNVFTMSYQTDKDTSVDFSVANFRIVKK